MALPGDPLPSRALEELAPASRFGRFRVLGVVGQGGTGSVYAAYDSQLDRRVALKVLHHSNPTSVASSRLKLEARALAKLTHPNVVAVHEVGTVDDRWFVAMEFVEGVTMSRWLEQNPPTSRGKDELLRILLQAGSGLAAAHAAGIVHRDFKPGNVLLGADGRVRVVDFGLARVESIIDAESESALAEMLPLASGRVQGTSPRTVSAMAGTPAYMAPEQFRAGRIDEKVDQFAFCAVAWEALFGEQPFMSGTVSERPRLIQAGPRAVRGAESLQRILRRGLAFDPNDRHSTLEHCLGQLSNHLTRPSRKGRTRLVAGSAAVCLAALALWSTRMDEPADAVCTGAVAHLRGIWDDARRTQVHDAIVGIDLAYATEVWGKTSEVLDAYAENWTQMHTDVCEATSVRREQSTDVMDLRMACLHRAKQHLDAATSVLATADAGVVQNAHKITADLRPLAACADEEALRAGVDPPNEVDAPTVDAARRVIAESRARREAGRYDDAAESLEKASSLLENVDYPPVELELMLESADTLDVRGKYDESRAEYQRALDLATQRRDHGVMQEVATKLLFALSVRKQQLNEALRYRGLAFRLATPNTQQQASAYSALGSAMYTQGKNKEAVEQFRRAVAVMEQLQAPKYSLLADVRQRLAGALRASDQPAESEREYVAALAVLEEHLGAAHPSTAEAVGNLGLLMSQVGRTEEGETMLVRALTIVEDALGREHPLAAKWSSGLGNTYRVQGRFREAEQMLLRAVEIQKKTRGPEDSRVAFTYISLGYLAFYDERYDEAEPYLQRALSMLEKKFGPSYPYLGNVLNGLARAYVGQGDYASARDAAERAINVLTENKMRRDLVAEAEFALARALWHSKRDRRRALKLASDVLAVLESLPPASVEKDLADVRVWLAEHAPAVLAANRVTGSVASN